MEPSLRMRQKAFTLLEIMLAVAILSIIASAVYGFTNVSLQSARFYTETGDQEAIYAGFRRLVESQLAALPGGEPGALLGFRSRGKDGQRDSLQVVCAPGNGALAADARGNYEVLIEVREWPRRSGRFVLGIERRPHEDDDDDDDEDETFKPTAHVAPIVSLPADWVPLIEGVHSLEINYFDSRLNGWVERWPDQTTLPNLVRFRFEAGDAQPPYEFVARVPSGGVRQGLPTFAAPPVQAPGTRPVARPGAPVAPLPPATSPIRR